MEERQNWIGTLRGIAVLLVFLSHLDIPVDITPAKAIQFILGRCGVVIFFLIMGYLAIDARKKETESNTFSIGLSGYIRFSGCW